MEPNRFLLLLASLTVAAVSTTVMKQQVESTSWPGVGGIDFPTYNAVPPNLKFDCPNALPGYYADPETQCQVWHWCLPSGQRYSFLCPNGTIFNQKHRVCDWWFNVKCAESANFYNINTDLYKDAIGNPI